MTNRSFVWLEILGGLIILVTAYVAVFGNFQGAQMRSKLESRRDDLRSIANALMAYEIEHGPLSWQQAMGEDAPAAGMTGIRLDGASLAGLWSARIDVPAEGLAWGFSRYMHWTGHSPRRLIWRVDAPFYGDPNNPPPITASLLPAFSLSNGLQSAGVVTAGVEHAFRESPGTTSDS